MANFWRLSLLLAAGFDLLSAVALSCRLESLSFRLLLLVVMNGRSGWWAGPDRLLFLLADQPSRTSWDKIVKGVRHRGRAPRMVRRGPVLLACLLASLWSPLGGRSTLTVRRPRSLAGGVGHQPVGPSSGRELDGLAAAAPLAGGLVRPCPSIGASGVVPPSCPLGRVVKTASPPFAAKPNTSASIPSFYRHSAIVQARVFRPCIPSLPSRFPHVRNSSGRGRDARAR